MSLREKIDRFGAEISPRYQAGSYADFAPAEETAGFVDTSAGLDGSRGIAFLCDRLRAKLGKSVWQAYYADITETEIIDSYESPYADELVIRALRSELRVADYSLDKRALKALIDQLCEQARNMTEETLEREYAETASEAVAHFAQETAAEEVEEKPVEEIAAEPAAAAISQPLRREHFDVDEYLSEKIQPSERSPMSMDEILDELDGKLAEEPVVPEETENFSIEEEFGALEDLTHEETLSYLLSSISEINAPSSESISAAAPEEVERLAAKKAETVENFVVEIPREPVQSAAPVALAEEPPECAESPVPEPQPECAIPEPQPEQPPLPEPTPETLTPEPDSEDIYIKASRKLREFCESGKLSRGQITAALKENLISAANAFSDVTAAAEEIPEGLAPKIAELRAASDNLEHYFALGEDIAERVMFFMMYQMLSYSDRIVETPETKERLNDFFRRYGPSGITLSMLDMRIQ